MNCRGWEWTAADLSESNAKIFLILNIIGKPSNDGYKENDGSKAQNGPVSNEK